MAAVLILGTAVSGCALFPEATLRSMDALSSQQAGHNAAAKDAIALEVFFIERPQGDPLIGTALWSELDQIGTVSPDVREDLRRNGIRFGLSGVTAPYALRALMNSKQDDGPGHRTLRQEYQSPSGVTHQYPLGRLPQTISMAIEQNGSRRLCDYEHAQGMLKVRVERTQAGWARVEVLPEVHHGQMRMRPIPTEQKWDWTGGQEVDSLYGQRLTVELNQGELLVLGGLSDAVDSVGGRLFRTGENGEPVEKLLVLRLASMHQVQPVVQATRSVR